MAAWLAPMIFAGAKGGIDMWAQGAARGAREKAGRTQNQNRVIGGKKQVRLAWKELVRANERDIESLNILKKNTAKYLDREDAISTRDWLIGELDRRDRFAADVEAYNQSILDSEEALRFNAISNNIALEEESNYMQDFHTKLAYEAVEDRFTLDDAMTKANFLAQKAQIDIESAINKGASEREIIRLQNIAARAESAHQSQQEQIKGMQSKGKMIASLGAGRSSRKAVQTVDMDVGMKQSMRIDALLNRNSVHRNQLQASYDNTDYQKLGFKSTMDTIETSIKQAQRDYGLSRAQAESTLQSGLRANKNRLAKIAAGKYSADLQARNMVHSVPKPDRMEPKPFLSIRPEFDEIDELTDSDKQDFYDAHMPQLSDENKIYGDAGGSPNAFAQVANIGLDMFAAGAKGGAFGDSMKTAFGGS